MRTMSMPLALALALLVGGCDGSPVETESPDALLTPPSGVKHFAASLSGSQEVPAVPSYGQGVLNLYQGVVPNYMHYEILVTHIRYVTAAHLHMAPAGANGPVVLTLYTGDGTSVFPPWTLQPMVESVFNGSALTGPLAGGTTRDLMTAIRDGQIYINIHTLTHPAGEIRGQLTTVGIVP